MFIPKLACATLVLFLASQSHMRGATLNGESTPLSAATVHGANANDASVQSALETIANEFMVAWQKQDMTTISNILAPDFLFAGPHGVKTRAYTLNVLTHCTLGKFTLEDFQLRQTSADSAILLYKIHRDLTCFGKKDLENTLNTDTFLRKAGKWTIMLTTEGELPGP
jgi:hypothetical protein